MICAFGQLESAWPVSGSVLVHDGSVIFAAGRSSHLDGGLRLFSLDARSGELRAGNTLDGPHYDDASIEQNYQLPMGLRPDIFQVEDSKLFMHGDQFDPQTLGQIPGKPELKVNGGFLDDAYFKRMPWIIGKAGFSRVLVQDDENAYCLRMFDSLAGLDPKVFFTPGKKGYLLYATNPENGGSCWSTRVPVRGRAMVVTSEQLVLAGPPDIVDRKDPLGSFEGRLGGVLKIIDKTDGREITEHKLPSPPVFNGAAAAAGRLVLSLEDGSIVCFGR
jgi:hypothetical protein